MCLTSPTIAAPRPQQATRPPAPPVDTKPPVLGPQADQQKTQADLKRKGTQIFRNDLSIPTGGKSTGAGLNIPK